VRTGIYNTSGGALDGRSTIVDTLIDTPELIGGAGARDRSESNGAGEPGRVGSTEGKFTIPAGRGRGRLE
jgi:hypothetical protein